LKKLNEIIFIADFFANQVLGGGELNNDELIKKIIQKGHSVKTINSHLVTSNFVEENKENTFIVANFINLRSDCIRALYNKRYAIYEHDHKYLSTRDPGHFKDFLAPKDAIVNFEFYKRAKAVFCQSKFHLDIINKNLKIDNLVNLSGNLWDLKSLEFMRTISQKKKQNLCSVMSSSIYHKNTREAVLYCEAKNLDYTLISDQDYYKFLEKLGTNQKFIFFPKTPETLSRVVVEARMMNVQVIVNKMIGATKESWFSLKGQDLVDLMIEKRNTITDTVIQFI